MTSLIENGLGGGDGHHNGYSNGRHQSVTAREDQPLLRAPEEQSWKPPRGFLWIQVAIMSNVFLCKLAHPP